jgi:signal transduction histidine kinase
MLALTTVIRRSDGSITVSGSALFPLPPELMDRQRQSAYLNIVVPGWSPQEFGYWNFARLHENGDLYIYPSIILKGKPRPRKRYPGFQTEFSQSQIERYAEDVEGLSAQYETALNDEFNILVHDLRQLSTSIHFATEEAFSSLSVSDFSQVNERLQNISAMQQMLSIRTDLLDYTGNARHYTEYKKIYVYKKVDKVVRSFKSYAGSKGIKIHLEGSSLGGSLGPNVLEIVPYVILDNAIKYSPRGNDITVSVREISNRVMFTVKSAGPVIDVSEKKKIFDKGVRGEEAKLSGIKGTGAGLFVAKQVVGQFKGTIDVETSNSEFIFDDIKFTDVNFTVTLPLFSGRYS